MDWIRRVGMRRVGISPQCFAVKALTALVLAGLILSPFNFTPQPSVNQTSADSITGLTFWDCPSGAIKQICFEYQGNKGNFVRGASLSPSNNLSALRPETDIQGEIYTSVSNGLQMLKDYIPAIIRSAGDKIVGVGYYVNSEKSINTPTATADYAKVYTNKSAYSFVIPSTNFVAKVVYNDRKDRPWTAADSVVMSIINQSTSTSNKVIGKINLDLSNPPGGELDDKQQQALDDAFATCQDSDVFMSSPLSKNANSLPPELKTPGIETFVGSANISAWLKASPEVDSKYYETYYSSGQKDIEETGVGVSDMHINDAAITTFQNIDQGFSLDAEADSYLKNNSTYKAWQTGLNITAALTGGLAALAVGGAIVGSAAATSAVSFGSFWSLLQTAFTSAGAKVAGVGALTSLTAQAGGKVLVTDPSARDKLIQVLIITYYTEKHLAFHECVTEYFEKNKITIPDTNEWSRASLNKEALQWASVYNFNANADLKTQGENSTDACGTGIATTGITSVLVQPICAVAQFILQVSLFFTDKAACLFDQALFGTFEVGTTGWSCGSNASSSSSKSSSSPSSSAGTSSGSTSSPPAKQ